MLICGYCRLFHSNINYNETPSFISKFIIEYFHFNLYDLGFKDQISCNIWLASYFVSGSYFQNHFACPYKMHPILESALYEISGCSKSEFPMTIYNVMNDYIIDPFIQEQQIYIPHSNFIIFYEWFIGVCYIIKDILPFYKNSINALSSRNNINISSKLNISLKYLFENERDTLFHHSLSSNTFTFRISKLTNNCLYIAYNAKYFALKRLPDGSYGTLDHSQLSEKTEHEHEHKHNRMYSYEWKWIYNKQEQQQNPLYYNWPKGQFYPSIFNH